MGRRERKLSTSSLSALVRQLLITSTNLSCGVFSAGAASAIELSSVISILFRFGIGVGNHVREIGRANVMSSAVRLRGRPHAGSIVAQR